MMPFTARVLVLLLILWMGDGAPVRVTQGDDVTLNCTYTHSNNPTVIWKSPKGKVLPESSSLSLKLSKVSTEQEGIYQCHIPDVRFQQDVELIVTAKKMDEVKPTGGAAASHPSVCFLATLLFYLYV